MSTDTITETPISAIRIANPRSRSKAKWQTIVQSIGAVGLKRAVTVIRRSVPDNLGKTYDLVCGQGRIEALTALGQENIPAIIVDVPQDELLLMSLVENIARRPPSNTALLREVEILRERGYQVEQIGEKIGVDRAYIYGVVHLVEKGEEDLVKAVEAGRIQITTAA